MGMRKKHILLLALGLIAAACGGVQPRAVSTAPESSPTSVGAPSGDGSTTPVSKPKLVDPRSGGFEVGFGEYAITTESTAIRPGRVTFAVRNGGKLTHGLEMKSESDGSNRGPGGGGDERFKIEEPTFGPGGSFELELTLPPGVYELECYVGNHDELGMRTILNVSDDAPLVEQTQSGGDTVEIEGFSFAPKTLEVPAGTSVTWRNGDPTPHTVTARDNNAFGSDPLDRGAKFSVTFDQPGEYRYYCAIHPTMEGVIRVTA
jgi:plastocyanin